MSSSHNHATASPEGAAFCAAAACTLARPPPPAAGAPTRAIHRRQLLDGLSTMQRLSTRGSTRIFWLQAGRVTPAEQLHAVRRQDFAAHSFRRLSIAWLVGRAGRPFPLRVDSQAPSAMGWDPTSGFSRRPSQTWFSCAQSVGRLRPNNVPRDRTTMVQARGHACAGHSG